MIGDLFSHTRSLLDVSDPSGSFNRKCQMGSDKIGVALVEVEVVIQYILTFRKTDTFPDQSRDSMPQGKIISFYVHRFDISRLEITKYYFSHLSNNSSTFSFLNKLSVVDCVRIEVPE